ncbi:MAG: DUF4143 domain-containing protein [Lachnospiraceae bacterium]|nr:DUF4143 domain-containing protein [Lachnospiraceae bacterium]
MPLRAYCELDAFKVYFLDIGLLSCMSGLTSNILTTNDDIFVEFKGILTEQFVLQEIKSAIDYFGYYYTNKTSTSEIDFLINNSDGIIPIEVKAGINLKAKSLKTYIDKYNPPYAIKTSLLNYAVNEKIKNFPLYCIRDIV